MSITAQLHEHGLPSGSITLPAQHSGQTFSYPLIDLHGDVTSTDLIKFDRVIAPARGSASNGGDAPAHCLTNELIFTSCNE
jgi:hypothetical protein